MNEKPSSFKYSKKCSPLNPFIYHNKANERDITHAYHRLGRLYHPDKHRSDEDKRNAVLLFERVKRVYDGGLLTRIALLFVANKSINECMNE